MNKKDSADTHWAIEAQGLTKSFDLRPVVNDINLRVERGEFVVIFGPNGAGKTTLLKMLATIMNPSSGTIVIDGLNSKANAVEIRRKIGVVTHQSFLYSHLTAYENLDFFARMYDIPKRRERISEALDMVEMTGRQAYRVGTLSRGMQQRLSIARALLHKPTIILLDEPETGLDQQASVLLRKALAEEKGAKHTIIHATHALQRAYETCDRVLIMNRGKIAYEQEKRHISVKDIGEVYRQYTGMEV